MITSDTDAYNILMSRLTQNDISKIEQQILNSVILLMNNYSFVNNQTYPRPFHPDLKKRKDPYFTLIAIILSLRTTLENEQKAVDLFMKKYNSIEDVINSDVKEIENTIHCAGMPQKKSLIILNVSKFIFNNYSGDINNINNNNIIDTREKLLQLPGIGEKSADCMLELAFNLPSIVIDTNVFRVINRMYFNSSNMNFESKKDISKIKNFLENNIVKDYRIYQIIHTIILLHGKYICKSKPYCSKCIICDQCQYYLNNSDVKQLKLF